MENKKLLLLIGGITLVLALITAVFIINPVERANYKVLRDPKIGIVIVTKNPEDFGKWLKYHLRQGISHFFVFANDTPNISTITDKYRPHVTLEHVEIKKKNVYVSLQDLQRQCINKAIKQAKGLDYLFHVDDDELICVTEKYKNVKDFFAKTDLIKFDTHNIHFNNVEAVFGKDKTHCFDTKKFKSCGKSRCSSYTNGKSAGVLRHRNLRSNGPHYFSGRSVTIPLSEAMILHFDSCSFNKWLEKFSRLSVNTTDKDIKKIPFSFYRNSIKLLQECCKGEKCPVSCQKKGKRLWAKEKVDPYYKDKNLIHLSNLRI